MNKKRFFRNSEGLEKTQVRLTENALAFGLKRTCVLLKTYLRLNRNALAFFREGGVSLKWVVFTSVLRGEDCFPFVILMLIF